jgi:hypothetical protein
LRLEPIHDTKAVISAMRDFITALPGSWPWLSGVVALALPRLIRELRQLLLARAVVRLANAAIDKSCWSDDRFELVLTLIRDIVALSNSARTTAGKTWRRSSQPSPKNAELPNMSRSRVEDVNRKHRSRRSDLLS